MADYSSGAIYFTGLGNGTDFDSIIDATMTAEGFRLTQLEDWRDVWQEKATALQDLNTDLLALRTSLKAMDTIAEFVEMEASATNSSALGVTATGEASEGTHTVTVGQLAQHDIWVSTTGQSDTTSSITATDGTFTYEYAGEAYTVDIAAGTTLQGLVGIINGNSDSSADVRATLINDGSEYHLQLYGMTMGEANTVEVTASTVSGYKPADFEHTQTAQSAWIKVNGYPTAADEWIERDTNTVDDVIEGVTLSLQDEATDVRISIAVDADAIADKVYDFVAAVNEIRVLIDELTSVDDDGEGSLMTGNYGVNMVEQQLKNIVASSGLGFVAYDDASGTGDVFSSLSQIGITTDVVEGSDTYGQLIFDVLDSSFTDFDEALAEDPMAVALLFAADNVGESLSSDFSHGSNIPGVTSPGEHEVSYEISDGVVVSATINGEGVTVSGTRFTGASETIASGLTVQVNNLADGTYSGIMLVKQGKIAQMVSALSSITDPEDGTLNIIADNYQTIIDDTETRITAEEDRLDLKERVLRDQYSRLEETLAEYESLNTSLESLIDGLATTS